MLKAALNILQLKVIISVPPIPSNGTLCYIWLQTVTVMLRERYLVSVTNQLASVFARKATLGRDVIGVWQVTMDTLTAGHATAVRLAVLLLYVMLQGSVRACTTSLDERVTSATLVTTSILSVCVSITCAQISAASEKVFLCEQVHINKLFYLLCSCTLIAQSLYSECPICEVCYVERNLKVYFL